MTMLNHFLEEGEISDPDENLICVLAGAAPSTAGSRTQPQRWALARREAEQTMPGCEALGVEEAGPASPAALLSPRALSRDRRSCSNSTTARNLCLLKAFPRNKNASFYKPHGAWH